MRARRRITGRGARSQPTRRPPHAILLSGRLPARARVAVPRGGTGFAVEAQLVEHGVFDHGQLVIGRERGDPLAAVRRGAPAGRVVARCGDVERVDVVALEQLFEAVHAQAAGVSLDGEWLAAGARNRVQCAGIPGGLDRDPSAIGRHEADGEADRFLGTVGDQHFVGRGWRSAPRSCSATSARSSGQPSGT